MARDYPGWFALHLGATGHAHLPAWQASQAIHAPRWAGQAQLKERYFGSTFRDILNTLVGGLFILLLVTAVLVGEVRQLLGKHEAPTVAVGNSNAGVGAPAATPEPVLAYEFAGAVTRDSCETVEEFVHDSNWLDVGDNDAVALLATRAMRCQDKEFWSRKDDALMACLRAERGAALGAHRLEDARRCPRLEPGPSIKERPLQSAPQTAQLAQLSCSTKYLLPEW